MKQVRKDQLFDLEVLEQTEKGPGEDQLVPRFIQNRAVQFHPNFRPTCIFQ